MNESAAGLWLTSLLIQHMVHIFGSLHIFTGIFNSWNHLKILQVKTKDKETDGFQKYIRRRPTERISTKVKNQDGSGMSCLLLPLNE
jgi:hypothetical protein